VNAIIKERITCFYFQTLRPAIPLPGVQFGVENVWAAYSNSTRVLHEYFYQTGTNTNNSRCKQGCGTFFQLTPPAQPGGNWTEQVLYEYTKADYDCRFIPAHPVLDPTGMK
jgi:hypothetical protein